MSLLNKGSKMKDIEEIFEDIVADVDDIISIVNDVEGHLRNAESCEEMSDLKANLKSAESDLQDALMEVRKLLGSCK